MKKLALSMGLLIAVERVLTPLAADAAAVTYTPKDVKGGAVDGEVPVNKVGDLLLTDAAAIIKGNVIDVESKDIATGVKKTVLSGVVFNTKVSGSGVQAKVQGYVYFRQGSGISTLDDVDCEEMIDIEDGGVVGGKIVAVNRDELVLSTAAGERRVPVEKIKRICSPRIFSFVMPVVSGQKLDLTQTFQATAKDMKFERTTKRCTDKEKKAAQAQGRNPRSCCPGLALAVPPPRAQQPAQGGAKIVVIAAIMLAIAAAIAIPIAVAVPLANRKKPPPPLFIPPPPPKEQPPPKQPPPPPRGQS